jgi:hypothetical protein
MAVLSDSEIDNIYNTICKIDHSDIVLLKQKTVIQWLCGDLSFLPEIEKTNKSNDNKKYKIHEDNWGKHMLKMKHPEKEVKSQWSNTFGESLCKELYILCGKHVSKPEEKDNKRPDYETEDVIVEVKTGTFYTPGTAMEKILGCPFKYVDIPELYGKPLHIVCLGGAEKKCREQYGNLPGKMEISLKKQQFIDFYLRHGIQFVGASDILNSL